MSPRFVCRVTDWRQKINTKTKAEWVGSNWINR